MAAEAQIAKRKQLGFPMLRDEARRAEFIADDNSNPNG
jgi:hypothetical protein